MSAFAALQRQLAFRPHDPPPHLLRHAVTCSNYTATPENAVFTLNTAYLGLAKPEYLVLQGSFRLRVVRGACLVNSVHYLAAGAVLDVVTSAAESLPVVCPCDAETESDAQILPGYDTVLALENIDTGLEKLATYAPPLAAVFPRPSSQYTFDIVLAKTPATAVSFDAQTHRALTALTAAMCDDENAVCVVFGVKSSGKSTFAMALANNVANETKRAAYMNLDPGSTQLLFHGAVSHTAMAEMCFSAQLPHQSHHCYYGYATFAELPAHYAACCRELIRHHREHVRGPLVVDLPAWTRGLGHELLAELVAELAPTKFVYLSHNGATALDGFEQSEFEAADTSDDDVLAPFGVKGSRMLSVVKGTRRTAGVTAAQLRACHRLLCLHQQTDLRFDFALHLLAHAPAKLPLAAVAGVCVLGHDAAVLRGDALQLMEATVVGIFATAEVEPYSRSDPFYVKFLPRSTFILLCLVHSVGATHFNVYVPHEDDVSERIARHVAAGAQIVLARGDGEVPLAEFLAPHLPKVLPYISFDTRPRLGGVWKARNIGRKNGA